MMRPLIEVSGRVYPVEVRYRSLDACTHVMFREEIAGQSAGENPEITEMG